MPNRHQPKKSLPISVGARVVWCGWVGLYGRPGVGDTGLFIDELMSSGVPQQATIKAHLPSTQQPSPLQNHRLGFKLMPIGRLNWMPISITQKTTVEKDEKSA
jgi:hypothetical protein